MIKTIGFPGRYLQGPDAVQHAPELLKEFLLSKPVVLMDDLVRASIGDLLLKPLNMAGIETTLLRFAGECTSEAIEQLAREADQTQADVVIGYGGGKTIDAAKGIAKAHNLRLIIVPTIASNDFGCISARVAIAFRSRAMFAFFKAPMNWLYEWSGLIARSAALIFTFQSRRKSPFLSRRCANEYVPACEIAS